MGLKGKLCLFTGNNDVNRKFLEGFESLGFDLLNGVRPELSEYLVIDFSKRKIRHSGGEIDLCFQNTGPDDLVIDLSFNTRHLNVTSLEHTLVTTESGGLKVGCRTISRNDLELIKEFLNAE